MGGITSDERQLTLIAAPQDGKVRGPDHFFPYDYIVELFSTSHNVNVVTVVQVVNVSKEGISMSSDDRISCRPRNSSARHMPRA